jgi:hypothetical protein
MLLTAGGASAQEYSLGDLGKPDDYDLTIKSFRDTVDDFDTFVEQLPTEFNWKTKGKVTKAKDQQSCGSCWAFASVGAFESKLLIKGESAFDLSEQQQISCNTTMYGCNGGYMSALRFWETLGPMKESCTGYPSADGSMPDCLPFSGCETLAYRTMNYYTVNMSSRDEIKASLYNDGPTYFSYNVYSDFNTWWNSAGSGEVYKQSSGTRRGGHAVLLIGWSDTKGAWLLKNSWGETNGPNKDGTFWMAYTGHAKELDFGMANVEILQLASSTVPVLIYPKGTIMSQTPTFKWSKVANATKYRYQVHNDATRLYTQTVSADACGARYCTDTPTTSLEYAPHKWRAQAYVSGVWKNYSSYKKFIVSTPSANFDVTETQYIDEPFRDTCEGETVATVTLNPGTNKLNVDFTMPAVDMDMNVEEPDGSCAWWGNTDTTNGGKHGGDVRGSGTETYAITNGPAGVYTIRAYTHGSAADATTRIYGTNGSVDLKAAVPEARADKAFNEGQ